MAKGSRSWLSLSLSLSTADKYIKCIQVSDVVARSPLDVSAACFDLTLGHLVCKCMIMFNKVTARRRTSNGVRAKAGINIHALKISTAEGL